VAEFDSYCAEQGSFPNLTVGTAWGPALGELYKKHPVSNQIRLFESQSEIFSCLRRSSPQLLWSAHCFVSTILFHETIPVSEVGEIVCIGEPCLSEPCQNGATCTANNETGAYECICPPDYTGVDCQMGKYL